MISRISQNEKFNPTTILHCRGIHSSSLSVERKASAINRTPSRTPYANASRSEIEYISFIHSSNFSSVSFCLSVSIPHNSSRLRETSFSNSLSRLSPQVHCSNGEMFPYHSSSRIFITILRIRKR